MTAVYCLNTYKSLRNNKKPTDKLRAFTESEKKRIKKDLQKGYMMMLANFNQNK